MKNVMLAFAVIASASGCASSSMPINDTRSVPIERVFRADALPLANNARVVFVRDAAATGAAAYLHLYIDGKKASSLTPGERIEFMLTPGQHAFGATPADTYAPPVLNATYQDLKADKTYFYRIQTDASPLRTSLQRFVPDYR